LFDGANDWLTHSGDFTGAANSKLFTMSCWFKLNQSTQNATDRILLQYSSVNLMKVEDGTASGSSAANDIYFLTLDSGFGNAVRFVTASTFTASSTWHHLYISFDTSDSAKRFVYVDGVLDSTTWLAYNNVAILWAGGGDTGLGATAAGVSKCAFSFAEVWIGYGQYLGASPTSFRSAGGKPVNLGTDGSTPTGTAPLLYLKNAFGTFQNNLGTGGNLTVHGALEDDPAIP
jgi:hypothetical protein